MAPLVAACVIVFVAAIAQAVTGFGFALIAVPLLTLATDARTAVVAATIASLAVTTFAVGRERGYVRWRDTAWLLLAGLAGLPVGLLVLVAAPDRVLTVVIAVCALCCTVLVWRGVRLRRTGPAVLGGVGVLTGALTTATGTNGPPLVAAFQALGYDAREFRATLAAVFSGLGAVALLGFAVSGQLDQRAGLVGVLGVPAVALGWWVGDHLFTRLDGARFRRVVLAGLVVTSVVTLVHAITA